MRRLINGYDFQEMVRNGLYNIRAEEQKINSMNVFPVADGDTGTNMRLTLQNGFTKANKSKHLGMYLKELAAGMLLGARGNSGVILSQLFKGMSLSLADKGIVNPGEIRAALIRAYQTAYAAVVNPVEGTILTVAREGIEHIQSKIVGRISIETTLKMYLKEMNKSLQNTPELLPALKEASVLDSGAYGYIIIIEGMYKYLVGEDISIQDEIVPEPVQSAPIYFDENSEFIDGYCMEFLLQLLTAKVEQHPFDLSNFIEELKPLGNSLVALQEEKIIKIHIHTLTPSLVIDVARQYGEFINFKLENMQLQHNEYSIVKQKDDTPQLELGIIAVVNGDNIAEVYKEFGCTVIPASGNMNVSSKEFLDAIESLNAKKIVIFPNNSNTFGAANQAISLAKAEDKVFICPTKTMMEGLIALQFDLPDDEVENRLTEFNNNVKNAVTIALTSASKNYEKDGFCCKIHDKIALINDELVSCGNDLVSALKDAVENKLDLTDKSGMLVYLGKNAESDLEDKLNDYLSTLDGIDYQIIEGGQDIYDVLIGLL